MKFCEMVSVEDKTLGTKNAKFRGQFLW